MIHGNKKIQTFSESPSTEFIDSDLNINKRKFVVLSIPMRDFSLQKSGRAIQVKTKVWLEIDGHRLFGEGRAQLFRLIRETNSINASAKIMGISFRRAWGMVKDMEETLELLLVEKRRGGINGGMATLTPAAIELLERYEAISNKFRKRMMP